MKKTNLLLVGIVFLIGVAGFFFYDSYLGETEEASGPITATALPDTTINAPSGNSPIVQKLEIAQENSEARFIIFEELRGEPVDVVGATDQVAGQIEIDLADLSQTRLGAIRINARTFVTDADKRNRAIRNRILYTDDHEFITFTPTELKGLSGQGKIGETVGFTAIGDLQIREIVQPVEFEIEMKIAASDRISGKATTTLSRETFALKVPDLPFLANVADEVRLEFEGEFAPISTPEPDA